MKDKCDMPLKLKEKRIEIIDAYTIKYHDKSQSIWSKGMMVNDQPDGFWQWYRKDGTLKRSGYFKNGEPVGEWITYDSAGQPYKITHKGTGDQHVE
jgi:antitoxin component YwqK of YwqJK toxin-antitoxin module